MSGLPMVSVVMSVFNGGPYLTCAVESITGQSFRDFEFIVIDDGSTDGSGELLEAARAADPRIRLLHQENRGLIASLNRGCGLAQGTYIARMDADDIALPERLDLQVAYLRAHRGVDVLGGAVEFVDALGGPLGFRHYPQEDGEIRAQMLDRNCIWHPTVLMRRDAFAATGGYREVPAAEDYDLWLRMASRGQLANLGTVLLKYRVHEAQATVARNLQMTLSALMSRGAAMARRAGQIDPLDSEPVSIAALGKLARNLRPLRTVDGEEERRTRLRSYLRWLLQVADVDGGVCLQDALAALEGAHWAGAGRREIAGLRQTAARLLFRQSRYPRALMAAGQAVLMEPEIVGRIFRSAPLAGQEGQSFDPWETPLPRVEPEALAGAGGAEKMR